MPLRPRSHELEDASRVALRRVLVPEGWVLRDFVPDYGVDGQVEIFEKGGSTGLLFNVQLKATDERREPLAVRFSDEKVAYYRALALPLLVVRYHAASDTLYARWLHSVDPYYDGRTQTLKVSFGTEDVWSEGTAARIAAEVEGFRRFKSPELERPIRFYVSSELESVHGKSVAGHVLTLRAAGAPISGTLSFTPGPAPPGGAAIVLRPDRTVVSLAGVATYTYHHAGTKKEPFHPETFEFDVLVSIAGALTLVGQPNLASQIAVHVAARSALISNLDVAFTLAGAMARASRVVEALQLAERFDVAGYEEVAWMFTLPALAQLDSLPPLAEEELRGFHRRWIERAAAKGDRAAAAAHYNLARHFMDVRRARDAFHHFRWAAKLDPDYLKKDYFCRELGGCLFEAGFYRLAAKTYGKVLPRDAGDMRRALYADALMAAGEYLTASEEFGRYIRGATSPKAEWRLKAWALPILRERVGDGQLRRPAAADALVVEALSHDDPEELRRGLEAALAQDALSGMAWFNLGVERWEADDFLGAFASYLLAAVFLRHDLEPWGNAILMGWSIAGAETFADDLAASDIFAAAWNLNEHALTEHLADRVGGLPEESQPVFVDWLEEQQAHQPSDERGFELRFPGRGSKYRSIHVRPPSD